MDSRDIERKEDVPQEPTRQYDIDKALTGDDLIGYIDDKLFPYLKGFRTRAETANTSDTRSAKSSPRSKTDVPLEHRQFLGALSKKLEALA